MGIGQDWAEEIKAAQDAIFHMGRKCADTNNFIFTGPEMNAVKMGMEIHDRQLEVATVRQLEQALSIVGKEIKSGKARPIKEKA
jgi:predicted transcriptional regulator